MKTPFLIAPLVFLLAGCERSVESAASKKQNEMLLRIEQAAHRLKIESDAHEELLVQLQSGQEAISGERREYREAVKKHIELQEENEKLRADLKRAFDSLEHSQGGLKGPICAQIRLVMEKLRERLSEDALSKEEQREYDKMIEQLRAHEHSVI